VEQEAVGEELAIFGSFSLHSMTPVEGRTIQAPFFWFVARHEDGTPDFVQTIPMEHSALPDIIDMQLNALQRWADRVEESRRYLLKVMAASHIEDLLSGITEPDLSPIHRTLDLATIQRNEQVFHEQREQALERYRGYVKDLLQRYPLTAQANVLTSVPPIPPSRGAFIGYLSGRIDKEGLCLQAWCEMASPTLQLGNFVVRPITRLLKTAENPQAYCAIQLQEKDGLIDVGIIGSEEATNGGTRQRIRVCIAAWERFLENLKHMGSDNERQQYILTTYHNRLNMIKANYAELL